MEMNDLIPGGPFPRGKPAQFDTAMRGYDRRQVDQHILALQGQVEVQRRRVDAADERAVAAAGQLAEFATESRQGFGNRVESMLRMAAREAAEIRAVAAEDAGAIREQARGRADAHLRELAQSLNAEKAEVAQQAEQLRLSLYSHQAAITNEIAAAMKEAAEIRATAERDARLLTAQADAHAHDVRTAAEQAATDRHNRARGEIARLLETRDGVLAELVRLQELLAEVFGALRRTPSPTPSTERTADVVTLDSARPTRHAKLLDDVPRANHR